MAKRNRGRRRNSEVSTREMPIRKKKGGKKKNGEKKLSKGAKKTKNQLKEHEKIAGDLGLLDPSERIDVESSDAMKELIQMAKDKYAKDSSFDPRIEKALGMLESGLGGLTAQENTALRENAMREINRGQQTAARGIMARNARSGVRGAAANIGNQRLNQDYLRSIQDFENKLMVDNINVQDQRRQAYSDFLSRENQNRITAGQNAFNSMSGIIGGEEEAIRGREVFNIGQGEKDLAKKVGAITGLSQITNARDSANKAYRLAARTGGGGGAAGSAYAGYSDAFNQLANNFKDQINNAYGGESSSQGEAQAGI